MGEKAAVAVDQGVGGGQQETRPAQSGLQQSGDVKNMKLFVMLQDEAIQIAT